MFGIVFVTTAIFSIACIAINAVIPTATRLPKLSSALIAINTPLITNIENKINTATHPTKPNSSASIANMKSLCASGIYKYFCLLSPSPTPNNPPDPIAYKPCEVWYAVPLVFSHICNHA